MPYLISKVAITAGAALALSVAGTFALAVSPATAGASSNVSDYWEQTHSTISISPTAGAETTILTLKLPAGNWVLHADETVVNQGPVDWVGCTIGDSANSNLNTHRTWDNGGTVLSETTAVSLSAPDTITVQCEADALNSTQPYVDPNADLWAHKANGLVITQFP